MAKVWELNKGEVKSNLLWAQIPAFTDIERLGLAPKETMLFTVEPSRRYWTWRNGRNQKVHYCYTVHRNVAGYFVGWVETWFAHNVMVRKQWIFRRKKSAVMEIQKRRWEKARAV